MGNESYHISDRGWQWMQNGRDTPTSLAARSRVLTPRDRFAHRGGGQLKNYAQLIVPCNLLDAMRMAAKSSLPLVPDTFVAKQSAYH